MDGRNGAPKGFCILSALNIPQVVKLGEILES